jgi:hypothetical protein
MSLRKYPTRTAALLAANRANAQTSTGPRTLQGMNRVALSALRHGLHAPSFLPAFGKSSRALQEFRGLYLALYAALLPDATDESAMDLLKRTALQVWEFKQELMRWAASRAEREAWFGKSGGGLSGSRANSHQAPRVEGAGLVLGATGSGHLPPLRALWY